MTCTQLYVYTNKNITLDRIGDAHTAGSDAVLTGQTFFKVLKKYFCEKSDESGDESGEEETDNGRKTQVEKVEKEVEKDAKDSKDAKISKKDAKKIKKDAKKNTSSGRNCCSRPD